MISAVFYTVFSTLSLIRLILGQRLALSKRLVLVLGVKINALSSFPVVAKQRTIIEPNEGLCI